MLKSDLTAEAGKERKDHAMAGPLLMLLSLSLTTHNMAGLELR